MHSVPGLFERLTQIYADGERAIEEARFQDAVALFGEGILLDDHFRQRYITMYAQRGFARQRMGDHAGALDDYAKAIEMEPEINQAQYHFHRGMCFAAIGQPGRAAAEYTRSIDLFPDHPGPYHLRGKLYASELEHPEDAIADFDRMLTMTQHPEAYQLRGYAKLLLGRGHDAIPDLMQSAQMAPDVYTNYLMAWAGAIAPDDELFYHSMQAVLTEDPSYKAYFLDNKDYARFRGQPRFEQIIRG
jgi:tetratricopeptide (TPR) repeat protein